MGALVHKGCGGRAGLGMANPGNYVCKKCGDRFPAEKAVDEDNVEGEE